MLYRQPIFTAYRLAGVVSGVGFGCTSAQGGASTLLLLLLLSVVHAVVSACICNCCVRSEHNKQMLSPGCSTARSPVYMCSTCGDDGLPSVHLGYNTVIPYTTPTNVHALL